MKGKLWWLGALLLLGNFSCQRTEAATRPPRPVVRNLPRGAPTARPAPTKLDAEPTTPAIERPAEHPAGKEASGAAPVVADSKRPKETAPRQADGRASPAGISDERIDLRTATVAELCELPGIGEARARAIVALREQRPLKSVRDLRRIRGIGPTTVRRLAPLVRVSSPKRRGDERAGRR